MVRSLTSYPQAQARCRDGSVRRASAPGPRFDSRACPFLWGARTRSQVVRYPRPPHRVAGGWHAPSLGHFLASIPGSFLPSAEDPRSDDRATAPAGSRYFTSWLKPRAPDRGMNSREFRRIQRPCAGGCAKSRFNTRGPVTSRAPRGVPPRGGTGFAAEAPDQQTRTPSPRHSLPEPANPPATACQVHLDGVRRRDGPLLAVPPVGAARDVSQLDRIPVASAEEAE